MEARYGIEHVVDDRPRNYGIECEIRKRYRIEHVVDANTEAALAISAASFPSALRALQKLWLQFENGLPKKFLNISGESCFPPLTLYPMPQEDFPFGKHCEASLTLLVVCCLVKKM